MAFSIKRESEENNSNSRLIQIRYVQHVRLFLQAFTHPRVDMKQIQAIPYQVPYEEPDLAAYELDDPMPKQPAADYFVEMERLRRGRRLIIC